MGLSFSSFVANGVEQGSNIVRVSDNELGVLARNISIFLY